MAKEFARAFYNSSKWKRCRESYKAKRKAIDGGMCEVCGKEPGAIVHHKIWLTPSNINDPDISLSHDNLRLDCWSCHEKEEDGVDDSMNHYVFGADGQIRPVLPP